MIKVAIECHKLESPSANERAGIGRTLYKFFEEINKHPKLKDEFRFYLYFKGFIPNIPFLENKIFVKKIAKLPFFIPFFRPSFNIFFHIALPFFCWKDKINVTFFPSFMMPAFFTGKSIAVLTNDIYYEYTKGTLPLKFKISYRLFANRAARQATYITPFTHYAKREIIKCFKLKPEKVEVVPLGIDSEQIMSYANRNKIKNKNYILYVGQAFPRRHLKETILAFEKIAYEFPRLNLIAIGHDKYNPPIIKNLVAQVNKNLGKEKIFYRKSVNEEELLRLYFEAQLLIYISSSEAMGLPPIEALAANTPAVVADDPLTHEIFGDNAFFVKNPDDINSIAHTIREALNDKDKKIKIVNNKDKVLPKYTWPKHTKQMLDIFKKVALDRY